VTEPKDIEAALNDAYQKYPGANHYCFAYRVRQESTILERCSDDGEPSGTAGWPILNVLKQKNLEDIMAIVVRYFGGTLLGTGGLVRAYTQCVQSALDAALIVSMEYSQKIAIILDYSYYGSFEKHFFSLIKVTNIIYTDHVRVELWISIEKANNFLSQVDNLTMGTANIEVLGADYVAK
jgi:uncharacterized YigZ family protein